MVAFVYLYDDKPCLEAVDTQMAKAEICDHFVFNSFFALLLFLPLSASFYLISLILTLKMAFNTVRDQRAQGGCSVVVLSV